MVTNNIIVVGYARAGMTILNRYLAGDQRLICLSEVNSRFLCPTLPNQPYEQLKLWYNIQINNGSFIDQVSETLEYCSKNNKILCIRDWSFGSFVPLRYNNLSPSNILNTIDDINNRLNKFEVICMVRNPLDIWLSMRFSEKTFHDKQLKYLLEFTKDLVKRNLKIIRYEDFVANPENTIDEIYRLIGIEKPLNLTLSNNVIGDINYPNSSRGALLTHATTLSQRPLSKEDHGFLRNDSHVNEISRILGYPEI